MTDDHFNDLYTLNLMRTNMKCDHGEGVSRSAYASTRFRFGVDYK